MTRMRISPESLEALELSSLLRLIAAGAATDAGHREVLDLWPSSDERGIALSMSRGMEAMRLLQGGPLVPSLDEPVLPLVEDLVERRVNIDGRHLLRVAELLGVTTRAAARIENADPAVPALDKLASELPDLTELSKRLSETLDARGRVRDDASPRLASLRRQVQRVRQRTYSVLEKYARNHGEELAEDTIPYHDDRLVLLLRSGSKGRLSGLVHGKSGSGQSFYFEPLEVVEANNEIRTAREEEDDERRRIFNELLEATTERLGDLEEHVRFLAELDLRQSAARWAEAVGATWLAPQRDGGFRLEEARHPLLDPRLAARRERALGHPGHAGEVVPLDIELTEERRLLVITGPNAGGKTVALKTLGLVAVASHCGLPVPAAASSRIPLLEKVVASVGDEQDLLNDRSTFSGRLLRLKEAWEWAGPRTLVLLDELGSGTDPEEGAALGIGLIEGLVERGALAAVSSHLTRLAAAALDLDGAACAAMAFDTASGRPTYQLLPGTPGGSEALSLARRLDLPATWVERAESLLGPEHGRLQELLAEVESVRDELAAELSRAQSENRRLAAEVEAAAQARAGLEEARDRAAHDSEKAVGEFRRKVRRRLGGEVERLRKEIETGRRRGLEAEAVERVFRDAPAQRRKPPGAPVEVGGRVRHRGLGWEGEVDKLEGDRVQVLVKGKRMVCRLGDLDALAPTPGAATRAAKVITTPPVEELPPKELQLRGERVETALELLDVYLDRALLAGLAEVRIVHGHGTGRLKKAVREALDGNPAVVKWRPGGRTEGGDGASVVSVGG